MNEPVSREIDIEEKIAALRARIEELEARLGSGGRQTGRAGAAQISGRGELDQEPLSSDQTIFVSIAAYCDPELPRTLDDCISNARHPENLRFGVCWQFDRQNPIDLTRFKADPRFRFTQFPIEESHGGAWARSIAQRFWDGETYTMQVDSHMKFEPGWDEKLTRMMTDFPSQKPLITMNAPLFWYDERGSLFRQTKEGIRATIIDGWSESMGWAPWFGWGKRITSFPARNRFISGNFVFTLGCWNEQVPQDPNHYYWGEEFNLTVRSYTHGYDFFAPDEFVAWHMCHFDGGPRRHWEHGTKIVEQKNKIAYGRLHELVFADDPDAHKALGRLGLGAERSKRDFEIYAGIDLRNKIAHPDAFTGECPDPVTIKTPEDWDRCISCDRFVELDKAAATG